MKKNLNIQALRCFAIIAVVMIHTSPVGIESVFIRPFINFGVATFLFLSGYLTKESNNWGGLFRRRTIRIGIPYIIWSIIYYIPQMQEFGMGGNGLIFNLLTAGSNDILYYVFVYLQLVYLSPLLFKVAKSKYRLLIFWITPISLIGFVYIPWITGKPLPDCVALLWHDVCLGWMFYYYLGLLLGNKLIKVDISIKWTIMMLVVAILCQIGEGYWLWQQDLPGAGTQLKLSALLTNVILMLVFYKVLNNSGFEVKNKIIKLIGDYSFGIYLSHIAIIDILSYFNLYRGRFPINSVIVLFLSLSFCITLSTICGQKITRWLGLK